MSSYDDPSWYEQHEQPDNPARTRPTRPLPDGDLGQIPEAIHRDGLSPAPAFHPVAQQPEADALSSARTIPQRAPSGYARGNNRGRGNAFGKNVVVIALLLIAFTGGWFANQAFTSSLFSGSDQSHFYANLIQQAWTIIDQNYVDRKAVNYQQMSYDAIRVMLADLHDKGHTYFLTPDEVKAEQQQLSGTSSGIGIYIQQDPKTLQVTITATVPGSPAEKAGFKSGDIIEAVNTTNVAGKSLDSIRALIEGPNGTPVQLTVLRPSINQKVTIKVTRAQFQVPSVIMHYIAEDHIAQIQVLGFDTGVSDQLKTDLIQAKKDGATSIILDLRDNPGGYLQEAIDTASLFLNSGATVLQEQDASGTRTLDKVSGSPVDTQIPMVVLVNGNTASAAEIVSGALQDNKRAIIMGTTTLGTGTVLNQFNLPDGSAIYLGVMEWLTPNGNFIRDKGITPNIKVNLPANNSTLTANVENQQNLSLQQILNSGDTQLIKAIQYLQGH